MVEYDIINNMITSEREVKYALNLDYYYNLYYNDSEKKSFSDIFMASLKSKSYTELYEILSNILPRERLNDFMKDVIEMTNEELLYNIHYWQKEKMDELVLHNKEERIRKEGKEEGIEQGTDSATTNMIKNMLNKNTDYEYISEITGKTIEEIKQIEETM